MAFSSADALESRSGEPFGNLPWNIIALMRPVQQQRLWPRFSLFFFMIFFFFLWFSLLRFLMLCRCFRFIYDTIYLLLCDDARMRPLQATRCESNILFRTYSLSIVACHWEFSDESFCINKNSDGGDHFKQNLKNSLLPERFMNDVIVGQMRGMLHMLSGACNFDLNSVRVENVFKPCGLFQ